MTRNQLYLFVSSICVAGYLWLGFNIYSNRFDHDGLTVCFFKNITGFPCASCGATRSLLAVLKGNLTDGILINPLGIILLAFMTVFPLWIIYDLLTKRNNFYNFYLKSEQVLRKRWVAAGSITLLLMNWIWNIYKDL